MSPEERKSEIVRGAIAYFAEGGFGSQTRELTQRLGISNALLFKYFPTKDALIEAIYEELFLKRWNPKWESGIADRTLELSERLERFYLEYSKMLHDREWVRIYLYSGLSGAPLARRFGEMVRQRIYVRVINELRHAFGFASTDDHPCTEAEIELMWSLHGSIAYIGIRKWIYGSPIPSDVDSVVCRLVHEFLYAAETFLAEGSVPRRRATPGASRSI
ncbi:TetR/AcrR family transcriptional regulator [Paraburkholderia sp. 22B1P]|uniref:TetR/AcrR family transcriptional regulator n=1 Tax=Paraburkholderia sp. 22B1P TaxID=3080498 RepID=UPI0030931E29|nr:TetR/AcrR family transcriptional regulator [Paraburkholderia sp. 22B1P]